MPLPPLLAELGIPEECVDQATSATEKRRRFVIHRSPNETIYRIEVDGCWLDNTDGKKVDYFFWCANAKQRLVLVELKGTDFGSALKQIRSTLDLLYKRSPELRSFATQGGVCVYVISSDGQAKSRRLSEIDKIEKQYGVIVRHKSQQLDLNSIAELC